MELQQSRPHPVEVATVRDKQVFLGFFVYCQGLMISVQALYVARRRERPSDMAKRIKNPTWWNRCILFICCVSIPQDANDAQDTGGQ